MHIRSFWQNDITVEKIFCEIPKGKTKAVNRQNNLYITMINKTKTKTKINNKTLENQTTNILV